MTAHTRVGRVAVALAGVVVLGSGPVGAQPADNRPPAQLEAVGIDQHLGAQLPDDLRLLDDRGAAVTIRELTGTRPWLLALTYYRCPMLCSLVLDGVARTLRAVPLEAGRDFDVVVVSIDPGDDATSADAFRAALLTRQGPGTAETGWHFLTGTPEAIATLTGTVGFRYRHDPATGQFAHASGVMVVAPDGRLSRYFYGLDYAPRDVRLGLVEAAAGRIGSLADQVMLFCFQYDPSTGRYSLAIIGALRVAGVATVIALGSFMVVMLRRERRHDRGSGHAAGTHDVR